MITQDIISPHRTHLIAESCYRLDELDVPDVVHVGPHQAGEDGPAGLRLAADLTERFTCRAGERRGLAGRETGLHSSLGEYLEQESVMHQRESSTVTSLLPGVQTPTVRPTTANRHGSALQRLGGGSALL